MTASGPGAGPTPPEAGPAVCRGNGRSCSPTGAEDDIPTWPVGVLLALSVAGMVGTLARSVW